MVSSTAFNAPPPDLPPLALMDMGFAALCQLARECRPLIRFSCPSAAERLLLHASFRPRLATTPLRFANPSPPSGWIRDSHPQTVEHARHTMTGCGTPEKRGFPQPWKSRCAISTFPPHDYCYIFWENLFPKGAFLTACTSRFRLILRLEKTRHRECGGRQAACEKNAEVRVFHSELRCRD